MGSAVSRVEAPASASTRPPYLAITATFAGICAALTVVVAWVSSSVARDVPALTGPAWLDGWFQMDSGWYFLIADSGYSYLPGQMSPIAFFPEYPLAVRAVGAVIGDYQVAGSLIGVLCGLATVLLFASWVWHRLPRAAALTAVAVLMLYPYALYLYGSMYADSLFILTAVGAFVLLEHRLYWLAGLAGALATAGRPVGVAVAIGLVVRMLEMRAEAKAEQPTTGATDERPTSTEEEPVDRSRPRLKDLFAAIPGVRWREAGVLLSGIGLIAWCVYLWRTYGDPVAFLTVQEAPGWYQGSGPVTWLKVGFARAMVLGPLDVALRLLPQALMCLLAVLLLHRVWRRFGWGYAAYSLVVLAIPIIGTKDFMGTGRYVLAAFPVLAAAGDYLAGRNQKWIRPLVLALTGIGLVAATVVYASGVEVS
ncbi:MAG: hypothetical protein ABWZ98_09400 [Nakamurella sp.]